MGIKTLSQEVEERGAKSLLERFRSYVDANLIKLIGLLSLFIITIEVHKSEVERRISMGNPPTWGGEILIIPIGLLFYYLIKSFKESWEEFKGNDWYA